MGEEKENFDKGLVKGFNFELELDKQKLRDFLKKANMQLDLVTEQALYELGCGKLVDGQFVINNAGALFFAREPQRFVEQSYVTCARYQGNSMASVIDRKDLEGGLLFLVDEAEAFVKRHTRLAYSFDGFKRIDIEEYPYDAIKEAIINAVCHRDYFSLNNVFVNVFDDRVEVISPGTIPDNLSIKQVYGESHPRNFKIVELFHKVHYIEKLGSGLKRMEELMLFHGLKKPQYITNPASFKVIFSGPGEKILELVRPSNELDLRTLGLNKRQIKALNYLQKKGSLVRKEYEEEFEASKVTAFRDLKELIGKGFIKSKESGRNTKYYLNQ
jgi:ATP-dependent DNA helicase RecG